MMGLRDIGATLPPGFRFYPSDEELVCHYLFKKIANEDSLKGTLVEIDLHTCEPWQLPEVAKLNSSEWYFFSFRDRKYATGFRTNRATTSGYWKATGKDRTVLDPRTRTTVGMRKTLVFYKNRAPNGIKTGWIMHEFRLENPNVPPKEDWVLCRVFHKAKAENSSNNNILSPQNTYEVGVVSSPNNNMDQYHALPYGGYRPNMAAAAVSQRPFHQRQKLFDLMEEDNNQSSYPQLSQEMNKAPSNDQIDEDEYGFLLDMNFEDQSLQDGGVHSSIDDMRFDNNNSLVFI
ncbi:NAC domain-containing protein 21/22 isoform X2 [Nicotiana tabacum]|uniref:NAC domain-containing protein 21/22 n=2 Tax=Nicotiana TaxID=4085 RepID=A0A1S3ZZ69_TOBAC|nr:PREDICTED: NAC domain-containing protein 21/22-like [Nicotiana sylvestris]XP_016469611.1 PREDICTED: NAC domain-containing protein 21/22-like [Nicotiana tabacum]